MMTWPTWRADSSTFPSLYRFPFHSLITLVLLSASLYLLAVDNRESPMSQSKYSVSFPMFRHDRIPRVYLYTGQALHLGQSVQLTEQTDVGLLEHVMLRMRESVFQLAKRLCHVVKLYVIKFDNVDVLYL